MTGPQLARLQAALARWVVPMGDCHIWTGNTSLAKNGSPRHPHTNIGGRPVYVRRLVWERDHGPIPAGLTVRATCGQDCCVAPGHLELAPRGYSTEDRAIKRLPRPQSIAPPQRICRECGEAFAPGHGNQVFCSEECRATRIRRVDRERKQRERAAARDR